MNASVLATLLVSLTSSQGFLVATAAPPDEDYLFQDPIPYPERAVEVLDC